MSLLEKLKDFAGQIATATTDAPDEYLLSQYGYEDIYATHKTDIKNLWSAIRPQLKRDLDQADWVEAQLQEMFAAFDTGEKERGRKAAWALYNADVTKLR